MALEKRCQLHLNRRRLRNEPGLGHDLPNVDARGVAIDRHQRPQHVLGVDDADNVVRLTLVERDAGIGAVQHRLDQFVRAHGGVEGQHLRAVHHDVADHQVAQVQ